MEALKRLAGRYRLVAMTNAQRWAFDHFARTLGHPFWDSITVDDAFCEKPDPNFFGFARGRISRSGFTRDQILHVAQSQYHDIGVAKALGYTHLLDRASQGPRRFRWHNRSRAAHDAGSSFSTLAELADKAA